MTENSFTPFSVFEIGNALSKDEYEKQVEGIRVDLVNGQYNLRSSNTSVLILLTGNDRKSVNETLDMLHEWMDARYLHTQVFLPRTKYEKEYPSYWRYWQCLPPKGRIGCFLGAWPMQALRERLSSEGTAEIFSRRIRHIQALEKTLTDNGTTVLKFWLHVPRSEVKKQLKKAKKHPHSEPYIRQEDWEIYEHYDDTLTAAERLVKETSTATCPWHIVEATDKNFRNISITQQILTTLKACTPRVTDSKPESPPHAFSSPAMGALDAMDLSVKLDKSDYKLQLAKLQAELNELAIEARDQFSTVLVFEGADAAGKGGAIRRITRALFAEDYRVIPIAAPTQEEKKYHYLWRFWRNLPRFGRITIFDRSWYGRVLVERVEGLAADREWQRAYYEINDFEDQLVGHKMVICKFWLQIDPDEQMKRFQERERLPYKNHKITEEDYRNREKWPAYTQAANEMISRTSTSSAPWHLIAATDKRWARIAILQTVVDALKSQLHRLK